MEDVDALEARWRARVGMWKKLADTARASGSKELEQHARKHQQMLEEPPTREGLGDWVANLTKSVGIPPCEECKRRQNALNSIDTSQPIAFVVRAVFKALVERT